MTDAWHPPKNDFEAGTGETQQVAVRMSLGISRGRVQPMTAIGAGPSEEPAGHARNLFGDTHQ